MRRDAARECRRNARIPSVLLAIARRLVWSPLAQSLVPSPGRLAFWRVSLIISDGFWFDTTKFRRVYTKPLKKLQQGMATM